MFASSKNPARKHPLVLTFSGIDGAGKSTQIEKLSQWLRGRGMRVHQISFWDDVAVWRTFRENLGHALFRGDKGVGTPDKPVERKDKNVQRGFMVPLRVLLILLDTLGLTRFCGHLHRLDCDVVIFDRYIYDQLANLYRDSTGRRWLVRGLLRLAPRPDMAFVLDADPEAARARKPEYPLDFLKVVRGRYLALSTVAGMEVIPPAAQEETTGRIMQTVTGLLVTSAENNGRVTASPIRQAELIDEHRM
jgi:thymidylate kinase